VPAVFSIGRPPVPGGRVLREYQRDGVRWLRYNYAQGRSAVLGDEMGLGKTAQVRVGVRLRLRLSLRLRTAHDAYPYLHPYRAPLPL